MKMSLKCTERPRRSTSYTPSCRLGIRYGVIRYKRYFSPHCGSRRKPGRIVDAHLLILIDDRKATIDYLRRCAHIELVNWNDSQILRIVVGLWEARKKLETRHIYILLLPRIAQPTPSCRSKVTNPFSYPTFPPCRPPRPHNTENECSC
jgi:hypothetical protein